MAQRCLVPHPEAPVLVGYPDMYKYAQEYFGVSNEFLAIYA